MITSKIAEQLSIPVAAVTRTLALLADGATVPFISRYRKEATGGLDEVQIQHIQELNQKLEELVKRKAAILKSLDEQGITTQQPALIEKIHACWDLTVLEDLYLPYKPKRKTRATVAIEAGLEPLAKMLMAQHAGDVMHMAARFVKGTVSSEEDALQGARDIVAEWVSEHAFARQRLRTLFQRKGVIQTKIAKGKDEEGAKYKDYFAFSEPLYKSPSHRILAMLRGEEEGFLKLSIAPEADEAIEQLNSIFVKNQSDAAAEVKKAIKDSYKRLLQPSLETECRTWAKEKADTEAIRVFAENLRQLLLAPPLGLKRILAIDPGYRTGCKIVCLDETGNLVHNETIYPHPPQSETVMAAKKIRTLCSTYKIEAIAIGNGTASRETEHFIQNKVQFDQTVQVYVVSESGASVYSASTVAREEFPNYDVTVRGAVSIGRRLADPLAELVKIDPKAIGVGQYQHDVDQQALKKSLDQVVESCVNRVGVNVNTASKFLLTYVSGVGPQLAQNIVNYRKENGPFTSRKALLKVPRFGEKAFEQAAGFLRITDGKEPLDNSAVHPESYRIVQNMAKDLGLDVAELIRNTTAIEQIKPEKYCTETAGLPTILDIVEELKKPGRDPRQSFKVVEFSKDVFKIDDLHPGMILPGIVTNITNFGAFVDVGVKQDGLVHISQLANRFVSDPNEVVKLHQPVTVKVLEVDVARKRIQFSMKDVTT